eukprot:GHVU01038882.1.p1 GENE.GHVU01038882.1~~GHVU01038882.1.p1  ORF type:complete len:135 (-),score=14.73 GHVU01038882.1:212-616(-)
MNGIVVQTTAAAPTVEFRRGRSDGSTRAFVCLPESVSQSVAGQARGSEFARVWMATIDDARRRSLLRHSSPSWFTTVHCELKNEAAVTRFFSRSLTLVHLRTSVHPAAAAAAGGPVAHHRDAHIIIPSKDAASK